LVGVILLSYPLIVLIQSSEYASGQLASLLNLSTQADLSVAEVTGPELVTTLSNAQRIFAQNVSTNLIDDHPWFGVGTNGYLIFVQNAYGDLPRYLTIGIHNEFRRIWVENGLVGLAIYVLPWIRSSIAGVRLIPLIGARTAALYFMWLSSFFVQCFFEGSGNAAFIAFTFMALLPDLFLAKVRGLKEAGSGSGRARSLF
jgi:O-antigen ligase